MAEKENMPTLPVNKRENHKNDREFLNAQVIDANIYEPGQEPIPVPTNLSENSPSKA